jgi:hypothetical protein
MYADGQILGVRLGDEWTDKATGEIRQPTRKTVDLYDQHDGPTQLSAPVELAVPPPGTQVRCRISVRAFPGFRQGQDPKVTLTVTEIAVLDAAVPTSNGRTKTTADAK